MFMIIVIGSYFIAKWREKESNFLRHCCFFCSYSPFFLLLYDLQPYKILWASFCYLLDFCFTKVQFKKKEWDRCWMIIFCIFLFYLLTVNYRKSFMTFLWTFTYITHTHTHTHKTTERTSLILFISYDQICLCDSSSDYHMIYKIKHIVKHIFIQFLKNSNNNILEHFFCFTST